MRRTWSFGWPLARAVLRVLDAAKGPNISYDEWDEVDRLQSVWRTDLGIPDIFG